jgi:hypothetical protein
MKNEIYFGLKMTAMSFVVCEFQGFPRARSKPRQVPSQ